MSLKDKLLKNSTVKLTSSLEESEIYNLKDVIQTPVPMINVALSGTLDGGLTAGVTTIAGPSRHFKSGFALLMAKSFLNAHPKGIILFYDTEFGTPQGYFSAYDIPLDSVVHTPITDIEQLKHDAMSQLNEIDRKDEVMIIIDSIGNIASKKEVDDAISGNSAADMTRAKQLKSFFRMVTPHMTLKNIPMVVINHTYKTMELYAKDVVSGGTGAVYSSDTIWILGRQQDKDADGINGYNFIINVEKSRYVKEKSKIPISVSYEGGILKWSGLLDLALEGNYIVKPSKGWYALVDRETGEVQDKKYREDNLLNNAEIWKSLIKDTDFPKFIEKKYRLGEGSQLVGSEEELEEELNGIADE